MITLTLTTEEADALHEALSLAHMERINQMVPANDPLLSVLARVIELIEAETVEGMIERGEIQQGALAIFEANLASNAAAYEEAQHPHSAQATEEPPAYTCPRCHRGMMQGATAHGDGWHHMECPDCGHTEEREAD